jgi:hypothetical protein
MTEPGPRPRIPTVGPAEDVMTDLMINRVHFGDHAGPRDPRRCLDAGMLHWVSRLRLRDTWAVDPTRTVKIDG